MTTTEQIIELVLGPAKHPDPYTAREILKTDIEDVIAKSPERLQLTRETQDLDYEKRQLEREIEDLEHRVEILEAV